MKQDLTEDVKQDAKHGCGVQNGLISSAIVAPT